MGGRGDGGAESVSRPQETVVDREVGQGGTLEAPVHHRERVLGDPSEPQPHAGVALQEVASGVRFPKESVRQDQGVREGAPPGLSGADRGAVRAPPGLKASDPRWSGGGGAAPTVCSGGAQGQGTIPGGGASSAAPTGSTPGDPMSLLMQGMAQLQQAYLGRPEGDLKATVDLPQMPEVGPDAAVEFSDWVYEAEQAIGSLSDRAALWFSACLEVARNTYDIYVTSSPLQRLSLTPDIPAELKDQKWSRLERKVMTLLLNSMKTAKDEVITYRISTVPALLYRMFVLYQPGGAAERTTILRHLEGQQGSEDVHACITALRRWRRYLQRAEDLGISVPDASILLKSVEQISKRALDAHPDIRFRVALTKNELLLHSRPETEAVVRLYNTILAELQMISPVNPAKNSNTAAAPATDTAKLKAVSTPGGGDQAAGATTTSPRKGQVPCKFFLTDSGCSKGAGCQFAHNFTKKEKAGRCWTCGSTQHQQAACSVKKGSGSPSGKPPKGASKGGAVAQLAASMVSPTTATTEATSSTPTMPPPSSTSTASVGESAHTPDLPEAEVRKLLEQANAMLSEIRQLRSVWLATHHVENASVAHGCDPRTGRTGMLDSGASHPLRPATTEEVATAGRVRVQLANGSEITLSQNRAGTLLKAADNNEAPVAPIVPLGSLVQDLGCDLQWSRRRGLEIRHPVHGLMRPTIVGGCPLVGETAALDLIRELEDLKVREPTNASSKTARSSSRQATHFK